MADVTGLTQREELRLALVREWLRTRSGHDAGEIIREVTALEQYIREGGVEDPKVLTERIASDATALRKSLQKSRHSQHAGTESKGQ